MSYKALYRTYRPKGFSDVIGQDHIIATLKNIIDSKKISHAYLFAGPRGTGKTSVAHVFAREVNRLATGDLKFSDLDIIEIDAASNNGVAEIRTIIDNARYASTDSRYKVYIIDEAHMLTKGAFNALLKTLEEPPAHVIFVLATTEAHKIPVTIISRCQRFNFKRIANHEIINQLKKVITNEKISADDESLNAIAKLANGGMRDALSIVDQVASFANNKITFESLTQAFGIVSIDYQVKLLNLAFEKNTQELIRLSNELMDNGADIERVVIAILNILRDFIVYNKTKDESLLEDTKLNDVISLKMTTTFAYDAIDVFTKTLSSLRYSEVPRQSFELSLLKISQVNEFVDELEQIQVVTKEATTTRDINVVHEQPKTQVRKEATRNIEPVTKSEEHHDPLFENLFLPTEEVAINVSVEQTGEFKLPDEKLFSPTEIIKTAKITPDNFEDTLEMENQEETIEEEILTSQENKEVKIEDVDEIMKVFSDPLNISQGGNENKVKEHQDMEIINLFIQNDKEILQKHKDKWKNILSVSPTGKNARFADELEKTKIISAGKNFLLVASENEEVIESLFEEYKTWEFLAFTKEVFGEPVFIFGITKKAFEHTKNLYTDLRESHSLPSARLIDKPLLQEREKTAEELYGEDIFGDLFK